MKFVVIGLGSMGKRRIRLLKKYIVEEVNTDDWNIVGVDANPLRCSESEELFHINTYLSLDDAMSQEIFDCAIISTSPHTHAKIINKCLNKNLHVFTEINLINKGYQENIKLSKEKEKVLFLSSTFMYRKEVEFIKQRIKEKDPLVTYCYHVGQYLPEWHPWENYKDFFVGRKETNGCRELFAIELPWLVDIFGDIKKIHSNHKKISNLNIEYDDTYHVLIEHESGVTGVLSIDVVTPKAERKFQLWSDGLYIGWNGTPDTFEEYNPRSKQIEKVHLYDDIDHREGYQTFIVENAYFDELVNFIHCVDNKEKARHTFEKDMKILAWIDKIEE